MFCVAPVVLPFDLAPLVERARVESGLKLDTLAGLMGISRQQLLQALSGERDLKFRRLLMVTHDVDGRRFFGLLMRAIFAQVGIEDRDEIAAMLHRVIDAFQGRDSARMAKAVLPAAEERKRA